MIGMPPKSLPSSESGSGAPRIYRVTSSLRIVALVFTALSLIFLVGTWAETLVGTTDVQFLNLFIPVVLTIAGGLCTLGAFRNYIAFSSSSIELHSFTGIQILPLDKVRGRRKYLDQRDPDSPGTWRLKLESDDDRYPSLDFGQNSYNLDGVFYKWFNALPDLDALDKTHPKTSNFGLI